jgi:hypothetical protein
VNSPEHVAHQRYNNRSSRSRGIFTHNRRGLCVLYQESILYKYNTLTFFVNTLKNLYFQDYFISSLGLINGKI